MLEAIKYAANPTALFYAALGGAFGGLAVLLMFIYR